MHGVPGVAHGPAIAPTFAPGVVLGGRYRVDHVLVQQGPQGTFLGTALVDGRPVVIESFAAERVARRARLLDGLVRRPDVAAHFMRPELAPIFDFGVEPASQTPFLVMAYDPARGPQGILTPNSLERQTAAVFLQTCLSVLDRHDREFLEPVGAMPTAVPYTAVPGLATAAPPAPPRAGNKGRDPTTFKLLGLTGRGWAGVGMLSVLVVYYATDDESMYTPYYNPRITEPTRLGWSEGGRGQGPKERSPFEVMAEAAGQVEISSAPSGAEVWVGGKMVGETPTSVPRPLGRERAVVVLRQEGYLDKQVTLLANSSGVSVRLIPLKSGAAPGLVGERADDRDPMKSRFEKSPFGKSPFDDSPLTRPPMTNPFGKPGTRAPTETPEELDEEDEVE